jgi:aminomethyltransferase
LQDCGFGLDAEVVDRSDDLAAVALQGPSSRSILGRLFTNDVIEDIGFYRIGRASFVIQEDPSLEVLITRTGYTGDLGYEIWIDANHAEPLWDAVIEAGADYGMLPVGMVALDIARIEAGLLLIDVDYTSAHKALIEARKSSPYEAGLGWTIALNKGPLVGRRFLVRENKVQPK